MSELEPRSMTQPIASSSSRIVQISVAVERDGGQPSQRAFAAEGDVVRVGSHPSNDVVLDDPTVSRFHVRISREASGWVVEDAGSLNGTRLNGVRVRQAFASPGSTLEIGESVLRLDASERVLSMQQRPSFGALYGGSLPMLRLYDLIQKVGPSEVSVLIEGESGTGKELVAAEIVRRSPRAGRPFVVIDCSAIPPTLLESELFGHARGAFTGAVAARAGAFENADGGTVFLDEVGELPLDMQPKLLRVLESRELRRVGETAMRKVDVRIVAATNRHLEREVNQGRFREDLFFRLSVVTLRLPPLRERVEDIPLLVHAILAAMGAEGRAGVFDAERLQAMQAHHWPGNVRELRNYVERATVLGDDLEPLGPSGGAGPSLVPPAVSADQPFKEAKNAIVTAFERAYLTAVLASTDGNITRAARKAQIDRMYMHRLIQKYGLKPNAGIDD
jgi:DNA-binding NtrC family response regulator